MQEIQAFLASQADVWIRRNNTGRYQTEAGHWVQFGLGEGGPDLVGTLALPFFGRTIAQAFGIEVKSAKGRLRDSQRAWHAGAELMGWRVCTARSVAEASAFLDGLRLGK